MPFTGQTEMMWQMLESGPMAMMALQSHFLQQTLVMRL